MAPLPHATVGSSTLIPSAAAAPTESLPQSSAVTPFADAAVEERVDASLALSSDSEGDSRGSRAMGRALAACVEAKPSTTLPSEALRGSSKAVTNARPASFMLDEVRSFKRTHLRAAVSAPKHEGGDVGCASPAALSPSRKRTNLAAANAPMPGVGTKIESSRGGLDLAAIKGVSLRKVARGPEATGGGSST